MANSTQKKRHKEYLKTARKLRAVYVLDVCDTFSYDSYPVYVHANQNLEEMKAEYRNAKNMQRLEAVLDVAKGGPI